MCNYNEFLLTVCYKVYFKLANFLYQPRLVFKEVVTEKGLIIR